MRRPDFGQLRLDEFAFGDFLFGGQLATQPTEAVIDEVGIDHVSFAIIANLGDLAGGGEGENEMGIFLNVAADNSAKVLLAFLSAWK